MANELTLFSLNLPAGAELTATGWKLPALTEDQWRQCGEALGKVEQGKQWWIGDWWNALPHNGAAGLGREACEAAEIEYQTAVDCSNVAKQFEDKRRRLTLSFKHHREVCAVPDNDSQDRLLDWCEEPLRNGDKKPRSTRELREAVQKYLDAQKWTDDERERRKIVEAGGSVVANQKTDENLIRWAQFSGRYVRIDRTTEWGNPFELDKDGTRDEVCDHYRAYLLWKPSLIAKLGGLEGKVLGCWCYPERCHGHELIEVLKDG